MPTKDKPSKDSSGRVKCPRCTSLRTKKNGLVRGAQRFLCQRCQTNFHLFNNKKHPKFLKPLLEFVAHAEVKYAKAIKGASDVMAPKRVAEILQEMVWDDRELLEQVAAEAREQDGRKSVAAVYYSEDRRRGFFTVSFTGGYFVSVTVPRFFTDAK
jgi:hypothetical protein